MLSLFNSKRRKAAVALVKAARARGMSVEDYAKTLSPAELAQYVPQDDKPKAEMPDVTLWGLPPDKDVTAAKFIADARVAEAVAAYRAGDWQPGAALLADLGADWDRRAFAVQQLGDAAADDDGPLKTWQASGTADAAAVHAQGLVALAWQIRSGLTPEHVSGEQWAGFFRVLEEAEAATRAAAEAAPADPTPWSTLLTVARGRQYDNDAFRAVWAELVARDPLHRQGHEQALQYWCAKWFGSHEQMFAFADEAAAKTPKLAGLVLVAAHEAEAKDVEAWKSDRTKRALDVVVPWLAGEGRDHPANLRDRAYAAKALVVNGRCDEAVEQFKVLGEHADALVWAYGGKPVFEFVKTRYLACHGATRP
ncbi:DUF4034 domain-containing protein [Amycolatopsis sp. DG1A-15b]|uniref:DUF4034 domain-containing protein n=1 Tax=Amycolatopsis sp. DG1A-15b TaxID=3052846 RepID=UPI00255BEAFB|nr:DUF4034 domain-containing protein [Amycolatopsis sp. DG1A-15b]WIX86375.1 DUF4034 domain-containing protein [Amycolatopsis sp. DG1A-15b]